MFVTIGVLIKGFHPELGGLFVCEFSVMVMLFCSRYVFVALKYGYMPVCDYKTVRVGEPEASFAVQMRHQLLTGWLSPNEAVLVLELKDAAARHRIDLDKHSIKIIK